MHLLPCLSKGSSDSTNSSSFDSTFFKNFSTNDFAYSISTCSTTEDTRLLFDLTRTEEEELKTEFSHEGDFAIESDLEHSNKVARDREQKVDENNTSDEARNETSRTPRFVVNGEGKNGRDQFKNIALPEVGSRSVQRMEYKSEKVSGRPHHIPNEQSKRVREKLTLHETADIWNAKYTKRPQRKAFEHSGTALKDLWDFEKQLLTRFAADLTHCVHDGVDCCNSSRTKAMIDEIYQVGEEVGEYCESSKLKDGPRHYHRNYTYSSSQDLDLDLNSSLSSKTTRNCVHDGIDCCNLSRARVIAMIDGINQIEKKVVDYYEPTSMKDGSRHYHHDYSSRQEPDPSKFEPSKTSQNLMNLRREQVKGTSQESVEVVDGRYTDRIDQKTDGLEIGRSELEDRDSTIRRGDSNDLHNCLADNIFFAILPQCCRTGRFDASYEGDSVLSSEKYCSLEEGAEDVPYPVVARESYLSPPPSSEQNNCDSHLIIEDESISPVIGLRNAGALLVPEDETEEKYMVSNDNPTRAMESSYHNVSGLVMNRKQTSMVSDPKSTLPTLPYPMESSYSLYSPNHKVSSLVINRKQISLAKISARPCTPRTTKHNWKKRIYKKTKIRTQPRISETCGQPNARQSEDSSNQSGAQGSGSIESDKPNF